MFVGKWVVADAYDQFGLIISYNKFNLSKRLKTKPTTLKEANEFVKKYHRHHRPTTRNSGKWAISVMDNHTNELVGVAIVGNPVSASFMDGMTLEITRLCVKIDAPKGTASFILSKCAKIWRLMGGIRILTYTLDKESGASLKGAGWLKTGEVIPHNNWKNKSTMDGIERDNLEIYKLKKHRWEKIVNQN